MKVQQERRIAEVKAAVFARNHRHYLEEARIISEADPSQLITFRSAASWTKAAELLAIHGTIPIYFAVIGDPPYIRFAADLESVHLEPRPADPNTKKLLRLSLPSTSDEGLWEKDNKRVKTLYTIKRCRELSQAFPMTRLIKVSDGNPIAPNYGYSYSVVHQLGSEPDVSDLLPGEVQNPSLYWEGATRQVSITTYERSQAARKACLRHHGYNCAACGFNFERSYGALGKDFIHVHHIVSLSDIDSTYEIDPISDLVPLCPNCHAMIHKEDPPLSIERLKKL